MKNNDIKIKMNTNGEAIAKILEDIAASMRAGTVCVKRGEDFVTLTPSDVMDLEIEAAQKKGKQKLMLELTWREVLPVTDTVSGLSISSEEPEIEEPVEVVDSDDEDDDSDN